MDRSSGGPVIRNPAGEWQLPPAPWQPRRDGIQRCFDETLPELIPEQRLNQSGTNWFRLTFENAPAGLGLIGRESPGLLGQTPHSGDVTGCDAGASVLPTNAARLCASAWGSSASPDESASPDGATSAEMSSGRCESWGGGTDPGSGLFRLF